MATAIGVFLPRCRSGTIDQRCTRTFALTFTREAPDREPVKIAVALIGFVRDPQDRALVRTLGRHDELTLYAVVAAAKLGEPDRDVFEIARHVDGWGRIQAVRRLARTRDSQIKAWLLREGYKNWVMHEYAAYICAVTGD